MDAIKDVGLLPRVRASGLLRQVYPTLGIRGGVEWVHDYLAGECGRKELERRLQTLPGVEDGSALVRLIDEKARAGRDRGRHADERMLARFASELLTHRFDLKLACWAYAGMNSLRLLHDERKISMSSANGLLQDFRRGAEAAEKTVIGHVVLKADVRGSTEITAQMRARNLNPAAYFSRNLYDPITRQLKAFGAQKVFVEGDAVILSLMEYEGQPRAHLAVARACGLACRILQVVEAKNAESRELGLPELGLGIGIAYSNEAPTYLYDEGHQIMISPAINRADRLSSCHSGLRQVLGNRHERRVVVAAPALEGSHNGKSGHDGLVRYNVNGIELEAAAFFQLGSELKLQHIRLPERGGDSADRYHVGRYLDLQGNSHWLVVRETPIPLWMGDRLLEGDRSGRVYYEVVTDEDIIASAKRRMRGMMRRH
jgi:class 3 adenylate cyclase